MFIFNTLVLLPTHYLLLNVYLVFIMYLSDSISHLVNILQSCWMVHSNYSMVTHSITTLVLLLLLLLTMIGMKLLLTITTLVSNIIHIYLLGILSVIIVWISYLTLYATQLFSTLLYLFISNNYYFIVMLGLIESFSILFSSVTISNRISINLLAGSLLIFILSVLVSRFKFTLHVIFSTCLLVIVFLYEQFNTLVQVFIYMLLSSEYCFDTHITIPPTNITRKRLRLDLVSLVFGNQYGLLEYGEIEGEHDIPIDTQLRILSISLLYYLITVEYPTRPCIMPKPSLIGTTGPSWSGVVYMAVTIEELVRLENNLHTADIPFTITSHRFVLPSGIIIYLVVVRFNDPHYSIIQSLISTAILTYDYIIYTAAQLHSFRSGRYNVFFLDAFDHITSYVYSESNTNLCTSHY